MYLLNMATDKKIEIVEFGKKIKHYRKERKLSQAGLAALAGIEPKQVLNIEQGTSDIRLSTAMKLIWALKVAPNDVIPFSISKE
ncbi:helix-turn-helix transcriptional regulator [Chitinophaga polysaccharea]|uniref:helix-turn-helix transcriptional regulator n=1 Tax=Chitinophaga polysaccharea TaxID=1293035 RepID=UPI00145516EC|nr:helix-turn-helix transcriptional regulator [Chitinophaga polysaccharea]NLR58851.1 helix-turn-helix transcriptional regulator [Chitinophaga polysaccharea]